MQLTIKKLRQAGFKVRVMHARHYNKVSRGMSGPINCLSGKGGNTTIEVTTPDKAITVFGNAKCSIEDSFNRKLGNSIALGRAVSKLSEFSNVKEVLQTL